MVVHPDLCLVLFVRYLLLWMAQTTFIWIHFAALFCFHHLYKLHGYGADTVHFGHWNIPKEGTTKRKKWEKNLMQLYIFLILDSQSMSNVINTDDVSHSVCSWRRILGVPQRIRIAYQFVRASCYVLAKRLIWLLLCSWNKRKNARRNYETAG